MNKSLTVLALVATGIIGQLVLSGGATPGSNDLAGRSTAWLSPA